MDKQRSKKDSPTDTDSHRTMIVFWFPQSVGKSEPSSRP